jgi:hypothetical protein
MEANQEKKQIGRSVSGVRFPLLRQREVTLMTRLAQRAVVALAIMTLGKTEETVMKRFWMIGLLGILFLAMAGSANAQAPMVGQPYAIPAGYEGYSAGTLISYGGYDYVTQDNGTMLLADSQDNSAPADDSVPIDTTAYQIPPGYENSQPGSQISYSGNDYTIMPGGTMMITNPGYSVADGTQYQIPPDYAGAGVGSIIPYGGSTYMVGVGVMMRINVNPGYTTQTIPGNTSLQLKTNKGAPGQPRPNIPTQGMTPGARPWSQTGSQVQVQSAMQRWPNQVQNQGQSVQRWPNQVQNQVQQNRWPNQNQVQQNRLPNQVYGRGYSGGPAFQPPGNGSSPVYHTGPSSGPVSRPGPMANPGARRRR